MNNNPDLLRQKIENRYKTLKALQKSPKKSHIDHPSDDELWKQAESYILENESIQGIDIQSISPIKEEQKIAKAMIVKYLNDYSIDTVSDRNTLTQLIYLEILHQRFQKSVNTVQQETNTIASPVVELMHKNLKEISALKEKLGIARNKNKAQEDDGYSYLQLIKQKYRKWLDENQASRYLICPCCAKSILLKIKTEAWEAQKHPFFRDRILGNEHLVKLYKEGKLTRKDLANIFETSEHYIDWLVEKGWGLNIEYNLKKD